MIVLCIVLIIVLFIFVAFIFHLIVELGKQNLMQHDLIEKLGDYIVKNKEEINAIKNSIYR